ncbi:hypothetical protein DYD21_17700 [Rhodohalobacter sp. SW132]|nr:hypothetical protein DYD21_17700 [Rhodohalobacter sp. SW132]
MRQSAQNLPDPDEASDFESHSLPDEIKMFAGVERYLHGTARPISKITGINPQSFPPLKKLNDAQAAFLLDEMIKLLKAYHFYPDFPKHLPDHIRYNLLRDNWNAEMVYTGEGHSHIEFCTYNPDECPFPGEFCQCKNYDSGI